MKQDPELNDYWRRRITGRMQVAQRNVDEINRIVKAGKLGSQVAIVPLSRLKTCYVITLKVRSYLKKRRNAWKKKLRLS